MLYACHILTHSQGLRSKVRTLPSMPSSPDELPMWNYDGSSTGQAVGHDSDVMMKPVRIYRDPWLAGVLGLLGLWWIH